ncbi:hypothetical protein H6P81_017689 [Aristolochia fimbriata]|uniref:Uncharacterized protein n=1 Tax=Aristolochia fimbriata TaxID=158543 RepID=A0AAV7E0V1_ARIFI|nr:hypothetical protein H6P81_017689 [Aristolochia fimbriata]
MGIDLNAISRNPNRALEIVRGSKPTRDPGFRIRSPDVYATPDWGHLPRDIPTSDAHKEYATSWKHQSTVGPSSSPFNQEVMTSFLSMKKLVDKPGTSGTPPRLAMYVRSCSSYQRWCSFIQSIHSFAWTLTQQNGKRRTKVSKASSRLLLITIACSSSVATKMHCVKPYVAPCQESPHFTPLLDLNLTQYFTQLHPSELLIRYGSSSTENRLGKFNIL